MECTVPSALSALLDSSSLLPGESPEEFRALQEAIIQEISPQSALEWLWTIDLIELSWDVLRYRALRDKVLDISREAAIQSLLEKIDLSGIPKHYLLEAQCHTRQNASQWRNNTTAAIEIEDRLAAHGIDNSAINLEVIVQARELFLTFDALLTSAQNRRIVLLREIDNRRIGKRRPARLMSS
jgi:hypothetical protein